MKARQEHRDAQTDRQRGETAARLYIEAHGLRQAEQLVRISDASGSFYLAGIRRSEAFADGFRNAVCFYIGTEAR